VVHIVAMRKDAKRNRDQIMAVSLKLIGVRGASVSMEVIAAEAGVAVGTLYRHHPTKAHLVAAVIEDSVEHMADLATAAGAAIVDGADIREELADLLGAIAARGACNHALRTAAMSLGLPDTTRPDQSLRPLSPPMLRLREALERILASGRAAGVLRADVTPADFSVLLRGVLDGDLDEEGQRRYIGIVLTGLQPSSSEVAAKRRTTRRSALGASR
jgi:AcrR family transcriptional regulator